MNHLDNYRLRDRAAFQKHCSQDDALIATRYPDRFVLHHRGCRFMQNLLRDNNVDLIYWPKYGLYGQDYSTFRHAAVAAGMEITLSCPSPDCQKGLESCILSVR